MTDKQQIETLQNDLEKALEWDVSDHDTVDTFMTAINLTKQGYSKIPENVVILTQEEYNALLAKLERYKNKKAWAVTKEFCEEYRKETAREIIRYLIQVGNTERLGYLKIYVENIDELVKQFGVEVE